MEGELLQIASKMKFIPVDKPKGTIIKNASQNPENWDARCSACDSKYQKEENGSDRNRKNIEQM